MLVLYGNALKPPDMPIAWAKRDESHIRNRACVYPCLVVIILVLIIPDL